MARIVPIVYPSNGLGVRNSAETARIAHRSKGISQPRVLPNNGFTTGPAAPGATVNLKGAGV